MTKLSDTCTRGTANLDHYLQSPVLIQPESMLVFS
jgi:hypothetical protein